MMVDIDKVKAEGNRILRCTQEGTPLERQVWEACLKDCLLAIAQLKRTLALRMIKCDSLQHRVAELESAASSLLERAEKPLNLDEILLQQALAPNQCTKCGKQMTAEKIKADGGIHTCMQKG